MRFTDKIRKREIIRDIDSGHWGKRLSAIVLHSWAAIVNNDSCSKIPGDFAKILKLQKTMEKPYLYSVESGQRKAAALELIALYHLAKASERLANFIIKGGDKTKLMDFIDRHFNEAKLASGRARLTTTLLLTMELKNTVPGIIDEYLESV